MEIIELGPTGLSIQAAGCPKEGATVNASVRSDKAAKRANDLPPVIHSVCGWGSMSMRQIASALNEHKIPSGSLQSDEQAIHRPRIQPSQPHEHQERSAQGIFLGQSKGKLTSEKDQYESSLPRV